MVQEFWHDSKMDAAIQDLIDIFMNVEGVQLVRLSGLTKRFCRISERNVSPEGIDNIIHKLKENGIINFKYTMICPHCQEVSYQIIDRDIAKAKLCDTCNILYNLIDGTTLKRS